jgi:Flp pilus assembly protein TadG
MIRRARELARSEDGVSAVEFAMISPALFVMLFGLFDLSYNMYTAEMLQGAIQKAARDSTIEGAAGKNAALDAIVTKAVHAVAPNATLAFSRKSYANFSDVARPEDYTDVNANETCDAGEPFEDANDNGSWDIDPGISGFGSARDAVLYSVTVSYRRPFPIAKFIPGQSDDFTLIANTVLRNQPYGQSDSPAPPAVGTCS